MVRVGISQNTLIIDVQGMHKLWAMTGCLYIPLARVRLAYIDPTININSIGIRFPGTYIPGVIKAGAFYEEGQRIFWDVQNPANTVVFALVHHTYDGLVVEVENPPAVVRHVRKALADSSHI